MLNLAELSDGELTALAVAGRQSAYSEIFARHNAAIYRVVRGHVGSPAESLDVVQETFIAAFAALERYDHARPLKAWLSRIAINKCRDWARRRRVRRLLTGDWPLKEPKDPTPAIDEAAAAQQELDLLWGAIASLPRHLKEPLILHVIEELPQLEAAQILGISRKAVETRVRRARSKLRQAMSGAAP